MEPETTSSAITEGVRVTVQSRYLPEQSQPSVQRYVFAYTVTIHNESEAVVQLKTRHWVVTHGDGHVEEVRGPGVVGKQPELSPGQEFTYTSGAILRTPRGTMHGTYQMVRAGSEPFDAEIATFVLSMPYSLN